MARVFNTVACANEYGFVTPEGKDLGAILLNYFANAGVVTESDNVSEILGAALGIDNKIAAVDARLIEIERRLDGLTKGWEEE